MKLGSLDDHVFLPDEGSQSVERRMNSRAKRSRKEHQRATVTCQLCPSKWETIRNKTGKELGITRSLKVWEKTRTVSGERFHSVKTNGRDGWGGSGNIPCKNLRVSKSVKYPWHSVFKKIFELGLGWCYSVVRALAFGERVIGSIFGKDMYLDCRF